MTAKILHLVVMGTKARSLQHWSLVKAACSLARISVTCLWMRRGRRVRTGPNQGRGAEPTSFGQNRPGKKSIELSHVLHEPWSTSSCFSFLKAIEKFHLIKGKWLHRLFVFALIELGNEILATWYPILHVQITFLSFLILFSRCGPK